MKKTLFYSSIVLAGVLVAASFYFYQFFHKSDRYLPGVHIAAFSVAGFTEDEVAQELDIKISSYLDTSVTFYYNDYTYVSKLNEIYVPPSVAEIIAHIKKEEKNRGIYAKAKNIDGSELINYPIRLEYNRQAIEEMMDIWNSNIAVDYVNAGLEVDQAKGLVITPSQPGLEVDMEATIAQFPPEIDFELPKQEFQLPLVLKETKPQIMEKDLGNMGELASFTTRYNEWEVDRTHNLKISAQSINGSMVKPGGTFSFNNVVGKRTYASGYRDAPIIVGGVFEPGLGGGICQVSSTLYNTVLLAGMDIVERHNHGLAVVYIPLGRDASVAYDLQDFKFRNNTNYPIYIRTLANQGRLTISIYGNIDYKQNIKIHHIVDRTIDFTEVRKVDDSLPEGVEEIETNGMPGYIVRSFRIFYDQAGNRVKTENLATDRYSPLNKIVIVGAQKDGDMGEDAKALLEQNTGEKLGDEINPEAPESSHDTDID